MSDISEAVVFASLGNDLVSAMAAHLMFIHTVIVELTVLFFALSM
jgi:hypothetical protein